VEVRDMSASATHTNDVDLGVIGELAEAIRTDPANGQTAWHARTEWTGGFKSATYARDHAPIHTDEPEALAGTNTAPNPVELVLAALGSCLTVGYTAAATARGIELRSLTVELKGALDLRVFLGLGEGHAGYSAIDVITHIDSDADEPALQALHDAVIGTSPVGHTVEHPVEINAQVVKV
jgi:uncharacterized OsmC-like protein